MVNVFWHMTPAFGLSRCILGCLATQQSSFQHSGLFAFASARGICGSSSISVTSTSMQLNNEDAQPLSSPTAAASKISAAASGVKDLYILRHGQATHNVRAEVAKANGCSFDEFLELMRQDDSLDSALTELGRQQAQKVHQDHGSSLWKVIASSSSSSSSSSPLHAVHHRPELVVSSPLSRALQTADLAFPPPAVLDDDEKGLPLSPLPRVCLESIREINGWLLNAKRRPVEELSKLFPHWDFSDLKSNQDKLWTETLESNEECRKRGYESLLWMLQRPEQIILLVAHGGILRQTMAEHEHVTVEWLADDNDDNKDARPPSARFENGEIRRYRFSKHHNHEGKEGILLTEVPLDYTPAAEAHLSVQKMSVP